MAMRKTITAALLGLTILTIPVAAPAQQADRVLTIYGNDKCPTNSSGEEIVVCYRRPEAERFRIPKEFRESPLIAPENQSWASRAQGVLDASPRTGIGSCSASGPAGWTGCFQQQMRAARAEREQGVDADAGVPAPR